eukprot:TRINITY_DN11862_c0_g1_i14.p1 TRINITY_DN11862_c0_g1~~TRINITY_DN11862_c0_g1_i14.p1  ORF type:complete len:268 (-),score=27.09 TRINITY_DN11862_c0_g1_i14:144-947(-)
MQSLFREASTQPRKRESGRWFARYQIQTLQSSMVSLDLMSFEDFFFAEYLIYAVFITYAQVAAYLNKKFMQSATEFTLFSICLVVSVLLQWMYYIKRHTWPIDDLIKLRVPIVVCQTIVFCWITVQLKFIPIATAAIELCYIYLVLLFYILFKGAEVSWKYPFGGIVVLNIFMIWRRSVATRMDLEFLLAIIVSFLTGVFAYYAIFEYKERYEYFVQRKVALAIQSSKSPPADPEMVINANTDINTSNVVVTTALSETTPLKNATKD